MSRNLRVLLVAERCVDQHQSIGVLDQQAAHGERNPVPLIRGDPFAPERSAVPRRTSLRRRGAGARPRACDSAGRPPGRTEESRRASGQESARGTVGIAARFGAVCRRAACLDGSEILERPRALPARATAAATAVRPSPARPRRRDGSPRSRSRRTGTGCRARRSGRPTPAAGPAARCTAGFHRASVRAPAAIRRSRNPNRTARCGPRIRGRRAPPAVGRQARRSGARARTISSVMWVMALMARRNRPLRVDQRIEDVLPPVAVDHHHGDLGDPVAPDGAHAGRLHVHHGKGTLIEQRRALCLGHESPASVGQLAHSRDRRRAAPPRSAHRSGRRRPGGRAPRGRAGRRCGGPPRSMPSTRSSRVLSGCGRSADHSGARRSGSDMQRGPPPPRASSAPLIVITVRCLASDQSSKARKLTDWHDPESRPLQLAERRVVPAIAHDRAGTHREEVARRAPLLPLLAGTVLAAGA